MKARNEEQDRVRNEREEAGDKIDAATWTTTMQARTEIELEYNVTDNFLARIATHPNFLNPIKPSGGESLSMKPSASTNENEDPF